MPEPDWLTEIKRAHTLREEVSGALLVAIKGARRAGLPWAKIGQAMSMTQQGARQHWKPLVEK